MSWHALSLESLSPHPSPPFCLLEPHCSEEEIEILRYVLGLLGKNRAGSRMGEMGYVVAELSQGRGRSGRHSHPPSRGLLSLCLSHVLSPNALTAQPSNHLFAQASVCPSVLKSLCHPSLHPSTHHPTIPCPFILLFLCPSFACPIHGPRYKDVVIHESLSEVAHDGVLGDLRQQHHVIHAALFHIVALPVEALLAALGVEAVA